MRKGIFDLDGNGELDVFERAAEMQFIDEVILAEEQKQPWTPEPRPERHRRRVDSENFAEEDDILRMDAPDCFSEPDEADDYIEDDGSWFDDEVSLQDAQYPAAPPRRGSPARRRGEIIGISFMGKPFYDGRKDSDGVKILKSLAVTVLCFGGMFLPFDGLAYLLGLGLCIALSMLILKNT